MSFRINRININITLSCLMFMYTSCVYSEALQTQGLNKVGERLCESISGTYQFGGETDGQTQGDLLANSLIGVMFGKPMLKGEPTRTELIHNVENGTLRVKVSGNNIEPAPDFIITLQCVAGDIAYQHFKKGHGDGSSYELNSNFRFSKDISGTLIVHKSYCIKSTNLMFFSSKKCGEATIRFKKWP